MAKIFHVEIHSDFDVQREMRKSRFIFILLISVSWTESKLNDEKCDQELIRFDAALESRELWALRCECFDEFFNCFT